MMTTLHLFYELRNGRVLLYEQDGGLWEEEKERYLNYRMQVPLTECGPESLEQRLRECISGGMKRISRRVKHRDSPDFSFTAYPFSRDATCRAEEMPVVSGRYPNLYYDSLRPLSRASS